MTYSIIGLLAIAIHLILNYEVFRPQNKKDGSKVKRSFRYFMLAVFAYYVTDALWGVFNGLQAVKLLYADTVAYYVAMASSVLLWTRYVILYLEEKSVFGTFLIHAGRAIFWFQVAGLIVNLFWPVYFTFDEAGAYHAGGIRYVALILQILMFLLTSAQTLYIAGKTTGTKKRRFQTVGFFGIIMIVTITAQYFYPLLPLYALGYLLGCCLIHKFVVEDERKEYLQKLEELLQIQQQQEVEIGSAKQLAYKDPLTGVKNKRACEDYEAELDAKIKEGLIRDFAVVSLDVNGLKMTNDTYGHKAGDELLISACRIICRHFSHSPVFRFGGDEFEVILQGQDYENRHAIAAAFNREAEQNLAEGKAVVSLGMADFIPGQDADVDTVFERADAEMYVRKNVLMRMGAGGR